MGNSLVSVSTAFQQLFIAWVLVERSGECAVSPRCLSYLGVRRHRGHSQVVVRKGTLAA